MLWAAAAAQCAGETYLTGNRIVVSLLRTSAFRELCQRLDVAPADVIGAVEDPPVLSFDECERRVKGDLAVSGLEFASPEHRDSVHLRPLDRAVKGVFDAVLEQHGHLGISPLELLLDLIRADPALEQSLAHQGLTVALMGAAIEDS
jgi:hypothetical protein